MGRAHFGTDGVRGVANVDLTAELALALGRATARVLKSSGFVVGRDTRRSGPLLQGAFSAGLATEGVTVSDVGVLPTPALALLARGRGLPAAVVSASHNPFQDNGIKLFSSEGTKLPVETEQAIEKELDALLGSPEHATARPRGAGVGVIVSDAKAVDEYRQGVVRALKGRRLDGLHVVLDCANGAASTVAPAIFDSLGARVDAVFDQPDGININDGCGSTHPAALSAAVLERGAALGLAFDGDADRCFVVDERGEIVSPSVLTALIAVRALNDEPGAAVIHNLITSRAVPEIISEYGGRPIRTRVGHSFIKAQMAETGAVFGGEHSGHFYFRDFWFADSGMLAALHVLAALGSQEGPLSPLLAEYARYVATGEINSEVSDQAAAAGRVRDAFAARPGISIDYLDGLTVSSRDWWFSLRPSNTEPLLRLNVEAGDGAALASVRDEVLRIVRGDNGRAQGR